MVVLHFDVEGLLGGNSYAIHIHKIIITNQTSNLSYTNRAVFLKCYPYSLGYHAHYFTDITFLEIYKSDIYRLCLAFIALILRILPLLRL